MISKIDKSIFGLIAEIMVITFILVISVPMWNFLDKKSAASEAQFYSSLEKNKFSVYEEKSIKDSAGRVIVYNGYEKEAGYILTIKINTERSDNIYLKVGNKSQSLNEYEKVEYNDEVLYVIGKATVNPNEIFFHNIELDSDSDLSYEFLTIENI